MREQLSRTNERVNVQSMNDVFFSHILKSYASSI